VGLSKLLKLLWQMKGTACIVHESHTIIAYIRKNAAQCMVHCAFVDVEFVSGCLEDTRYKVTWSIQAGQSRHGRCKAENKVRKSSEQILDHCHASESVSHVESTNVAWVAMVRSPEAWYMSGLLREKQGN